MSTAIDLFESVVRERRWIQGKWFKREGWREYVCLAAAWGEPGIIRSTADCPADLFPRWLFDVMPVLNDCVSPRAVRWLFQGFADRARNMHQFTPEQWHRIDVGFRIACVENGLGYARKVKHLIDLEIWRQVEADCIGAIAALRSGDDSQMATEEEPQTVELTEASWTATTTAGAWAAKASWASRAAARTVPWAVRAKWAPDRIAPWEAAYKDMAVSLFTLIDQEIA